MMTALRVPASSSLRTKPAFLALAIGSLLLVGLFGVGMPTSYGQNYTLIWSDEFNSVTSSNVDTTKWEFESGNNGGWGNNEREFYTDRTNNAYIAGGVLHMRAQAESTNGFPTTSVRMLTGITNGAPAGASPKFCFTYGRVEWRAKLPTGNGMWPALWMMGTNITNLGWPACGEIDVVEDNGAPNFEQGSLHNGGTLSDVTTVFTNFVGGGVANFHVYDFDWTTNSMVWSVDGVPYETRTQWTSSTGKPYPFPYNQPFYLLMNFATGGSYVGNPADSTIVASLPKELQVDYVRVFQVNPPTVPPSTVTGLTANLSGGSVVLSWYTANNAASYFVKRSLVSGGPYTTNANPTANGYTDTSATNRATYYYVVSGVNNIGEGTNSSEMAVTIAPPSAPTGLTATAIGPSVSLSWNVASNATSYYVKRSLTSGGPYTTNGTSTATSFTDTTATNRTTYYYVVSSVNNIGEGTNSSEVAVTIVPPSTPTGLTATATGPSVSLSWNVASNATSYYVKRSLTSGGPYTTNGTSTTTSFTDTNITSCTTYYYVVSAVSIIGESTNSSEASATAVTSSYFAVGSGNTSPVGAFVADTNFVGGTQASPSSATINTSNVTNPAPQAVYQHERYGNMKYTFNGLTTGASYKVRLHWAEIYFNAANSRKFNVLVNGTQVLTNFDIFASAGGQNIAIIREYTVAPVAGSIGLVFTNGTVDQAKIDGIEIILQPPAAPANLTASGGVAQVSLNWNAVSGVSGYNVKRSLNNGGTYTPVISGLAATNYTDTGLSNGTTYYYVVSSVSAGCNESTNSAQASATTTASVLSYSAWQAYYFNSTTNPAAATNMDVDGTGQNNQFKFVAGLDPTNPSSVFVLTIAAVTGQPNQVNLIFNPVVGGRTYTPQFSTDLLSGVWTQLTGYAGPVINGNQATITDLNAAPSNRYYRIDISAPTSP